MATPAKSFVLLSLLCLTACQSRTQNIDPLNNNGVGTGGSQTLITHSDPMDAGPQATNLSADAAMLNALSDAGTAAENVAQRPLSYDRLITSEDLAGRSLRELAIMRNMGYARHGHRFRRPWLSAYFQTMDWYHPSATVPDNWLTATELANSRAVAAYDQAINHAALLQMKDALLQRDQRNDLVDGDNVEAILLSTRLGEHITLAHYNATSDSSPLDDPERLEQLIPRDELLQMSSRDLWVLRNSIMARRGRPFRSIALRQAFEGADWYRPDDHYNDAALRRVDRQNIRLIQSVEAEIGGPTNAQEEDMMFQGA